MEQEIPEDGKLVEQYSTFLQACSDGDLERVKSLAGSGVDVDKSNPCDKTPLMLACSAGHLHVVKYLLSIGVNLNKKNKRDETAIFEAVKNNKLEIVVTLLKAGAIQFSDIDGVTPAILAARKGFVLIVSFLTKNVVAQEEHDAWKLLGATIVDDKGDFTASLDCWRSAFSNKDIQEGIESGKICTDLVWNPAKRQAYGENIYEVTTVADVDRLVGNPDAIYMQSLIIRERVLGLSINSSTFDNIRKRAWYYCDQGRWNRAYNLFSYIIQVAQHYHKAISIWATNSFSHILQILMKTIENHDNSWDTLYPLFEQGYHRLECRSQVIFEQILLFIDRMVYEGERYLAHKFHPSAMDATEWWRERLETECSGLQAGVCQLVRLVGLMLDPRNGFEQKLSEKMLFDQTQGCRTHIILEDFENGEAMPAVDVEVPLKPRCPHLRCILRRATLVFDRLGHSLVHIACMRYNIFGAVRYPSPFVIEQMLRAVPFSANKRLWTKKYTSKPQTPLHITFGCPISKEGLLVAKQLLEAGVPFLVKDFHGFTCVKRFIRTFCYMDTCDDCREVMQDQILMNDESLIPTFGRYITLKQLMAYQLSNQFKGKNGHNIKDFADKMLPFNLLEYIAMFE